MCPHSLLVSLRQIRKAGSPCFPAWPPDLEVPVYNLGVQQWISGPQFPIFLKKNISFTKISEIIHIYNYIQFCNVLHNYKFNVGPQWHPTSAETYMWGKQLAAMLAIYTSKCVTPEVNLREHISYTPLPRVNKAAHSSFETQRRHHQKSKTGISVTPKMDMYPTKNF